MRRIPLDTNHGSSRAIMTPMHHRHGRATALVSVVIAACLIAACGSSSPRVRGTTSSKQSTTTTMLTTTSATSTTSTTLNPLGVAIPDVIGMKLTPARFFLRLAGFFTVPLTVPCNKGTLTSQSIVVSLSIPGGLPNRNVGAVPLVPGSTRPKGSFVGITWSGCYPDGAVVPMVAGLTFGEAVNLLHVAGLTWACYSSVTATTTTSARRAPATTVPAPSSTTTTSPSTTSSTSVTTTTPARSVVSSAGTPSISHAVTTTTLKPPLIVLRQAPSPGTVLRPGAPVSVVVSACPQ